MITHSCLPTKPASGTLSVITARVAIASCLLLTIALPAFSKPALSAESAEAAVPHFVKLDPMTVNLQNLSQYLQIKITLKVASQQNQEIIRNSTPLINHQLILLLSSCKAGNFATAQDKIKILASIQSSINNALELDPREGVSAVLLESFIIQ